MLFWNFNNVILGLHPIFPIQIRRTSKIAVTVENSDLILLKVSILRSTLDNTLTLLQEFVLWIAMSILVFFNFDINVHQYLEKAFKQGISTWYPPPLAHRGCRSDPATSRPSSWARALTAPWCRPGTPPPRRRSPSRRSLPSSTRPTARCSQPGPVAQFHSISWQLESDPSRNSSHCRKNFHEFMNEFLENYEFKDL